MNDERLTTHEAALAAWLADPTFPLPALVREAMDRVQVRVGPDWRSVQLVTNRGEGPPAVQTVRERGQ